MSNVSALQILDAARRAKGSTEDETLSDLCGRASARDVVSALHTACLDNSALIVSAIIPHVDEVAKRQAFMAASAKEHLDVLRSIIPSLAETSFDRMLLAGAANGRARTLRVMLNENLRVVKNKPKYNLSVGKALIVAATNGHVEAVDVLNNATNDGPSKARAVVSAAARGKDKIVLLMRTSVPASCLTDPNIIGPLARRVQRQSSSASLSSSGGTHK